MQKSYRGIIICLILSIVAGSTLAQKSYSLKQCVETALDNNIPVKQTGLQAEAAKADWHRSRANLLPNLNGNWDYGWNQGRSINPFTNAYISQQFSGSGAGLSSSITLFNGLQLQNTIRQAGYAHKASEQEWQQSKDKLTLDVILAYLTVLNNEDVWEMMRERREVTNEQVKRLTIMFEKGATASFMLSDMKGQLAADDLTLVNNYNALQTAKLELAQLMNIPFEKDMKLERLPEAALLEQYATGTEEIYNNSLTNLAQVKAVDLRVKSAEKGVHAAKGSYYPSVIFQGNVVTNYSSVSNTQIPGVLIEEATGDYVTIGGIKTPVMTENQRYTSRPISYNSQFSNNIGTYFGVRVSVPIFNNLQVHTNVRRAKLVAKNAAYEADYTKLILRQSIERAHQDMLASYERYRVLQQQVVDYKESFRSAEIRFNLGSIVSTEYLLTKNNYDRALINLKQVWYEYIFRTRILDFYQGKLSF